MNETETPYGFRSITDVPDETWRGVRVLVRADINVAIVDGAVVDDFRLRRAAETIAYLTARGAQVIVLAHYGRSGETLAPVASALAAHTPITFVPDILGAHARAALEAMHDGDAVLLENLRCNPGEETNDEKFGRALAKLGTWYVNDAFAVSHRAHASIVRIPEQLPAHAGLVVQEEVTQLSRALDPSHPSLAILGGAKFETKEPLMRKLIDRYDHLFIGGALANDVFRAKGLEVGRSLVSEKQPASDILLHQKTIAPVDVVAETPDGHSHTRAADEVRPDEKIVDIGPESMKLVAPYIRDAQTILWNGPMGLYEGGYEMWTERMAEHVAASEGTSIVGGGDTVAAITSNALEEQFTFLSTGGGAMLEFLLKGTLPGIEALRQGSESEAPPTHVR